MSHTSEDCDPVQITRDKAQQWARWVSGAVDSLVNENLTAWHLAASGKQSNHSFWILARLQFWNQHWSKVSEHEVRLFAHSAGASALKEILEHQGFATAALGFEALIKPEHAFLDFGWLREVAGLRKSYLKRLSGVRQGARRRLNQYVEERGGTKSRSAATLEKTTPEGGRLVHESATVIADAITVEAERLFNEALWEGLIQGLIDNGFLTPERKVRIPAEPKAQKVATEDTTAATPPTQAAPPVVVRITRADGSTVDVRSGSRIELSGPVTIEVLAEKSA